ncbi:MAG: hypothetical protein P8L66_12595 [Rhodospirillaceae bacterium]|nr:hypothetical protein [Rhodospirillaceae bacterium]
MILSPTPSNDCYGQKGLFPIALFIFALIAIAFLTHLIYFATGVGTTALESFYVGSEVEQSVFAALQSILGSSPKIGRAFSVVFAITGLVLMARLCAVWTGDALVGAVMPLGMILFPQAAFVFALATPHALLMLLTMIGLSAPTWSVVRDERFGALLAGSTSSAMVFLDPTGLGLAVAILIFACSERQNRTFVFWLLSTFICVSLILLLWFPISFFSAQPTGLIEAQAFTVQTGVWQGFAMLWVALAFSVIALISSKSLRLKIGDRSVRRSVILGASFFIAFGWLMFWLAPAPSDLPIWLVSVLALGVVSALPLVLWVRQVMPSIQSIWIWILLPVVMYSCFWVILGPVNLDAFPYDQIKAES